MTREVFTPSPLYSIAAAGPHPITHPYQVDTEIACTIFQGTTIVELLNGTDFTVAPSSSETTGDVTLSAAIFAAYTGAKLLIRRITPAEQGWAGQTAREKGLEIQLDALTQRLQEIEEAVDRAIKLPEDTAPELPLDTTGLFLGFDASNQVYAGTPLTTTSIISAYMATLLDDPDALTARSTLGITEVYDSEAEMLASLNPARGVGSLWQAQDRYYTEAAPSASDHHHTTVDGVKLYDLAGVNHPSRRQTQLLMQKLKFEEDCNVILAGDSTGNETDEWFYLLMQRVATDFPKVTVNHRLWDTGVGNYAAPTTIQVGTGSSTMTVWNASIPGAKATALAGGFLETALNPGAFSGHADLVLISYGHNGREDIWNQLPRLTSFTGEVARLLPLTPIIIIGQNPNLDPGLDGSMELKIRSFSAMAAAYGFGFIDVLRFFKQHLDPIADFYVDFVHPNPTGSSVWAAAAYQAFGWSDDQAFGNAVSSYNRGVIWRADRWSDFLKATVTGATTSKDTVTYETKAEAMRISGNGTAGGDYVAFTVLDNLDIRAFRGRTVTLQCRIRVPGGSGNDAGRIALYDGVSNNSVENGDPQGSDWFFQSVSLDIAAGATSLTAFVYVAAAGGAGSLDIIQVDRMVLTDGPFPSDPAIHNGYLTQKAADALYFGQNTVGWDNLTITSGVGGAVLGTYNEPDFYRAFLTCLTAEHGYTVGQKIHLSLNGGEVGGKGLTVYHSTSGDISYKLGNAASVFSGNHRSTGTAVNLTNANWDLTITGYYL